MGSIWEGSDNEFICPSASSERKFEMRYIKVVLSNHNYIQLPVYARKSIIFMLDFWDSKYDGFIYFEFENHIFRVLSA